MVSIYVNYKSIGMKTYLFSFALLLGSLAISAQITVKARVYLEGALMNNGNALSSSGKPLMRDNLRLSPFTNTSYIPLNDPTSMVIQISILHQDIPTYQIRLPHNTKSMQLF